MRKMKLDFRYLVLTASILSLIGLVFVYSASCIYAYEKFGSSYHFLKKQVFALLLSIIAFVIASVIPVNLIKRYSPYLFLLALSITTLTLVPGFSIKIHGASRWVRILGLTFQPSEFLKLFLFIYLGFLFDKTSNMKISTVRRFVPFLFVLSVTFFILLKQPDFGSVFTIFSTSIILFFIAGVDLKYLLTTLLVLLPVGIASIFLVSYRLNRILVFLNPWSDPKGRGYQIIQSLIAIGSGGFWGLGIANSKQKFFYLPMQHTDFIFSIIAEEVGFIGSVLILGLLLLFCFLGLRVAAGMSDGFAFYTTLSFITFITIQSVINLMVVTGMAPTKGLGLPFISSGGSALICNFCMLGLIANFVRISRL